MAIALKIESFPLNLSKATIISVNSNNAPPIAARPLPISSQDIEPNLTRASAIILQDSASASIATLVLRLISPFPIFCIALTSIKTEPPTPANPFIISPKDSPCNFTIAEAKILTATAIPIIAIPACMVPFPPNFLSVAANALNPDVKLFINKAIVVNE